MKKRIFSILGFCFLLSLFMACKNANPTESDAEAQPVAQHEHRDTVEEVVDNLVITSRQYKAAGIELGKLQQAHLSGSIRATGTLDVPPQNFAEVSSYMGGIIKSIRVTEGAYVQKGQTVLTLEHPDFVKIQEEYTTAKGNLEFLEKEYQRQNELQVERIGAGKTFQEAESRYKVERGRLASIESQLRMLGLSTSELDKGNISNALSVRSPISGYIVRVHGTLGSFAEPNKSLFEVVDNRNVTVHLDVYEQDLYKIKPGQKVTVLLPNQENTQAEAEVYSVGKSLDNATKSVPVHARIKSNSSLQLIPGVFVNAFIQTSGQRVSAVPLETVVRSGEKQYVFKVNDELCSKPNTPGKDPVTVKDAQGNTIPLAYKMVEVQTGAEDKGLVEIMPAQPLSSADQLVVKGAYYLISALKSGETVGCCAPEEAEK